MIPLYFLGPMLWGEGVSGENSIRGCGKVLSTFDLRIGGGEGEFPMAVNFTISFAKGCETCRPNLDGKKWLKKIKVMVL